MGRSKRAQAPVPFGSVRFGSVRFGSVGSCVGLLLEIVRIIMPIAILTFLFLCLQLGVGSTGTTSTSTSTSTNINTSGWLFFTGAFTLPLAARKTKNNKQIQRRSILAVRVPQK